MQKKCGQISVLRAGFELTIPVFEWTKTFHVSNSAATVIVGFISGHEYYQLCLDSPWIAGGCQPILFIWRPWDVHSLNSSAVVKRKCLSICEISVKSWTTQVVYIRMSLAIDLSIWFEFPNLLCLHTDVLRT
jgi:hypothetical protein